MESSLQTILGDLDLDQDVDSLDLGMLLANFNMTVEDWAWNLGDLNGDGEVDSTDSSDLGDLLSNFGASTAIIRGQSRCTLRNTK